MLIFCLDISTFSCFAFLYEFMAVSDDLVQGFIAHAEKFVRAQLQWSSFYIQDVPSDPHSWCDRVRNRTDKLIALADVI